jgi:hypothetical protein
MVNVDARCYHVQSSFGYFRQLIEINESFMISLKKLSNSLKGHGWVAILCKQRGTKAEADIKRVGFVSPFVPQASFAGVYCQGAG